MPASKKSESLGSLAKRKGQLCKGGVCPLLISAADSVWCNDMSGCAITANMAAWLHHVILDVSVTPQDMLDFLLSAIGMKALPDRQYNVSGYSVFCDTADAYVHGMLCPDVDTLVMGVKNVDYTIGPTAAVYCVHDLCLIAENDTIKDATEAFAAGLVSRVHWEYDENEDKEPLWRKPNDEDIDYAEQVRARFTEFINNDDLVKRFAAAVKLI